jgi:[acyl-carrier-protein] S-malonyltransferase
MAAWLFQASRAARLTLEEAEDTLGLPLSDLIHSGPEDALALTAHAQPAILTVDVAFWRALRARGAVDDASVVAVAGHSLGEYAALVAAGAFAFPDALQVVRARALAMQAAVPVGEGAMAVIIGADLDALEALCAHIRDAAHEVCVAVYNAPQSYVISGHAAAVRAVTAQATALRRVKAIPLPVSGPFHSPLLAAAQPPLAAALAATPIHPLRLPYVPNTTAALTADADPDAIRAHLVAQVVAPVRWQQCLAALAAAGAARILHAGPGNMVAAQARQAKLGLPVFTLDDPATFSALTEPTD